MEWQTVIVWCFVALAAAFLAARGWRVLRRQRAKCQSHCGGCGRDELVHLERKRVEEPSVD